MAEQEKTRTKKFTIKDIARLARVSPSTVSIVLNGKEGVSAETRRRVLNIVKKQNYVPNLLARSLVVRRSFAIGMMIPNTLNTVFPEIAFGVDLVLKKKGYSLSLISTYDDPALEAREIEKTVARGLDGIITSSALLGTDSIPNLVKSSFPVICILRRVYDCPDLDYVMVDNVRGGYLATEHLIRLGHRRIGVLKGPSNISAMLERFEGAVLAMRDYGLDMKDRLSAAGDPTREFGHRTTANLLALPAGERPTAIYASNDNMALGAFEAILDEGLRVGDDVALVGFNNIGTTALKTVSLTTISQQSQELGRLAAMRIIERIENKGDPLPPYRKVLEPTLIIRDSCGYNRHGYRFEKHEKSSSNVVNG
jgi:LacI family transcriptional regulator